MRSLISKGKVNTKDLLQEYRFAKVVDKLTARLVSAGDRKYKLLNNAGSVTPLIIGAMRIARPGLRVVVLNDREEAAYFYNDVLSYAEENRWFFCLLLTAG